MREEVAGAGHGYLMDGMQICDGGFARRRRLRSVQSASEHVSQQLVLQDFDHAEHGKLDLITLLSIPAFASQLRP
jgi:hypothetical protein